MKQAMKFFCVFLIATGLFSGETLADRVSPTLVVRTTIDEVIRLIRDETLRKTEHLSHRRTLLEKTISIHFDFTEMAKRSLASHWKSRTPEERHVFVELFRTFLSHTYAAKIESYSGEEVQYVKERLKGPYAEVQTQIVSSKTKISLVYRLLSHGTGWKVYDVVVDGVSLVKNYRGQFSRIIRRSSFDELVNTLREKSNIIQTP